MKYYSINYLLSKNASISSLMLQDRESILDNSLYLRKKVSNFCATLRCVWIIGSPRSGTTLLASCLGNHPELGVGSESLFLTDLWRMYSLLFLGASNPGYLKDYTSEMELLNLIGEFSEKIFRSLVEKNNAIIYLDHTPWYTLILPFIKAIFPNSSFIYLARDGRQVVESLQASFEKYGAPWAGSDVNERSLVWREFTREAIKDNRCNNNLLVRYENLCMQPELELKRICEYISIEYRESMLSGFSSLHAQSQKVSNAKSRVGKDFSELSYWPKNWSKVEKTLFIKNCESEMDYLGYSLA